MPIFVLQRFGTHPTFLYLAFLDRCIHQSSRFCCVRLLLLINTPMKSHSHASRPPIICIVNNQIHNSTIQHLILYHFYLFGFEFKVQKQILWILQSFISFYTPVQCRSVVLHDHQIHAQFGYLVTCYLAPIGGPTQKGIPLIYGKFWLDKTVGHITDMQCMISCCGWCEWERRLCFVSWHNAAQWTQRAFWEGVRVSERERRLRVRLNGLCG